ncbi:MAG TPA: hypothetical protein VFL67_10915 [Mycobacterium sp.]|nr:hypothetical protein [Mycobacterium sp.]
MIGVPLSRGLTGDTEGGPDRGPGDALLAESYDLGVDGAADPFA